jgi:phosphatidylserine decarboxylase
MIASFANSKTIVGACGRIGGTTLFQAKGFPYTLDDLLCVRDLVETYRDGVFATLRLKSSMYHRFHAPHDGRIEQVRYISGDTWNVNPIALKRIERLFCKNERAVVCLRLKANGKVVTLVAVAAILVASIRLHCLDAALNRNYQGCGVIDCSKSVRKGEELGWFEHGSTIIVFAPHGFALCDNIRDGTAIRVGEPLMHLS